MSEAHNFYSALKLILTVKFNPQIFDVFHSLRYDSFYQLS